MRFLRALLPLTAATLSVAAYAQTAAVYDMDVTLKPADRSIVISGTATLPAQKQAQSQIFFQLAQQMKDLDVEIVAPAAIAQKLTPRMVNDNSLGTGNFSSDLSAPIPANTAVTVKFSYHGGDTTAFVFHIGTEGSYADGTDIAWYPEFGPRLDQNGKFSVDGHGAVTGKATYHIPSDLTLVASGAESAGPSDNGMSAFVHQLDHPTTFAFSLDKFDVLKSPGRIPVALYLKGHRDNEDEMLRGIRQIVDMLTTIYGPFPYPSFTLVEVNDEALKGAGFGGAGCPGFMLSSTSFLDQGFNIAFFGHEIGHQWWGNLVTHANEPEGTDLLDEAIAQYGSLYCVRHIVGDQAAAEYRWTGFPGYVQSQCGRNFLWLNAAGIDIPVGNMPADQGSLAHELACEKGFLVFEELRREIGDDRFHKALKAVTSKYAYQQMTWAQFIEEVDKAAGKDLSWFWTQWYDRTGAPNLDLQSHLDGNIASGVIAQTAPYYQLSIPVRFDLQDGSSVMKEVRLNDLQTPFSFHFNQAVTAVDLDPNFEVLHSTPETMATAKALVPFAKADWIWFTGSEADALAAYKTALQSLPTPDDAGLEFYLRCRLALLDYRSKDYANAIDQATLASQQPNRDPLWMPQCYQIIMRAASASNDKVKAASAAHAAIASEKSLGQYTSVSRAAEKWLSDNK